MNDDARWMAAALTLSERGRGRTWPNPNVGCVIVKAGRVVGRGWTQAGGRPHAEAMALAQAGEAARGGTAYVTLEPCNGSARGPACSDSLIEAGVARVLVAIRDPFPTVDGKGIEQLEAAGIDVTTGPGADDAKRAMAGFLTRQRLGRPHVTLKLALSLDGCIAMGSGESQWITGAEARSHGHLERARVDAIIVGGGTFEADKPRLNVRLAGLEGRSPAKYILTRHSRESEERSDRKVNPAISRPGAEEKLDPRFRGGDGFGVLSSPESITTLQANLILIEGGAGAASAFLRADLVDRLLIYRAPILIGGGKPALHDIGLAALSHAHGAWRTVDSRKLGADRLDIYERVRD